MDNTTDINIITSDHGRRIFRHSSNKGSVIDYLENGTPKKIFVPDGIFRPDIRVLFGSGGVKIFDTKPVDKFIAVKGMEYAKGLNFITPCTDVELDTRLEPFQTNLDSIESTQEITRTYDPYDGISHTYAANFVNIELAGFKFVLPSIHEMAVVWLESDNLDILDPTINKEENFRYLGVRNRGGRFGGYSYWTNQEYNADHAYVFMATGVIDKRPKVLKESRHYYKVLPIAILENVLRFDSESEIQ